jgi:hypothetical protein
MATMRTSAQGNQIEVELVHDLIRCALTHDAIADPVFELLYEHIVERTPSPFGHCWRAEALHRRGARRGDSGGLANRRR